MAVYNPPQQVLFSPVTNYYQGKAMRQQLAAGEQEQEMRGLQIESAKQELEDAPGNKQKAEKLWQVQFDAAEANLETSLLENGEKTMEFMATSLSSLTAAATEQSIAGDTEGALADFNEGIQAAKSSYPAPIAEKIKSGAGEDGIYSAEELANLKMSLAPWHARDPSNRTQAKFMVDGVASQGSFDKAGNYYYGDGKPVLGQISPISAIATQAELGGGAGTNQMGGKIREVMGSTDNLIASMDRIGGLIDKAPQASLGLPGAVSEFVDQAISSVDGFAEIAGGWAEINGQEVDSSALLDVRLYSDFFAGVSGTNAAIEANAIGVAYALARAANPDGRISDADVRHQLERLQLNQSSKTRIRASISEVRRESLSSAINWLRRSGATKFPEGRDAFKTYSDALEAMDDGAEEKGTVINSSDQAAYDALPSGTTFTDETGKQWTKP